MWRGPSAFYVTFILEHHSLVHFHPPETYTRLTAKQSHGGAEEFFASLSYTRERRSPERY